MRVGGYMVITDPDRPTQEWDTITCTHCNAIVRVKRDPGGWCLQCDRAICGPCADKRTCTPFERKLEAYERRERFRKSLEG